MDYDRRATTGKPPAAWEMRVQRQLNDKLAQVCRERPKHPICIWHQLSQADMADLVGQNGRAPALELNGQPGFSYLHRAWMMTELGRRK